MKSLSLISIKNGYFDKYHILKRNIWFKRKKIHPLIGVNGPLSTLKGCFWKNNLKNGILKFLPQNYLYTNTVLVHNKD